LINAIFICHKEWNSIVKNLNENFALSEQCIKDNAALLAQRVFEAFHSLGGVGTIEGSFSLYFLFFISKKSNKRELQTEECVGGFCQFFARLDRIL
jgi:hypothetical protein